MLARLSAFVIWGLVAATAVFWGLRLLVRASAPPSYAVAVDDGNAMRGDLTRLLGSAPVVAPVAMSAPETSARFRLLGIMAPKATGNASTQGVALIAVDGNLPKAYSVGASLDGELVLRAVSLRTASIGQAQGTPAITLELPPPVPPATGTPGGVNSGSANGSAGPGNSAAGAGNGSGRGSSSTPFQGRPPIAPQITPQTTRQTTPQFVPAYVPQSPPQPVPPPQGQLHPDDNATAQ